MTGYKSKKAAALDKLAQKSCGCANCGKKDEDGWALYCVACIDKIEAALAQPAQEPFGYLSIGENPIFQKEKPEIGRWETLYTTPPQRPWVDLTRTQIQNVYFAVLEEHRGSHQMQGQLAFGEALQAAIKEKNK